MKISNALLGQAIRDFRDSRGMTQKELARLTNLTPNYLSLLENGHRTIGLDNLKELSNALGIPASFILILAEPTEGLARPKAKLLGSLKTLVKDATAALDTYGVSGSGRE